MGSLVVILQQCYELFILGICAAFLLCIPVGPNGVLCIYRTGSAGWKSGAKVCFGAVTAVGFYAVLAATMASHVREFLDRYQNSVQLISGFLFIFLGLGFSFIKKREEVENEGESGMQFFLTSFLVGLINPKNIIGFTAVVIDKGNSFLAEHAFINAVFFSLGVTLVASLWYLVVIYSTVQFGLTRTQKLLPALKWGITILFIAYGIFKIGDNLIRIVG